MHIGILELTFHLEACHSLKEKRQVLRSLIDRLRNDFNASVAEIGYQDEWQMALVGVGIVSGDRKVVERMIEQIIDYADTRSSAVLAGVETEII